MKKKAFYLIWTIVFLGGAAASLFYLEGWRIHLQTGEIIPTGILDISLAHDQGALIFLEDQLVAKGSRVFRGYPLGQVQVRLEKSGYMPLELQMNVQKDLITRLRRVFLLPARTESKIAFLGSEEHLFWNPEKTGYVVLFSQLNAIKIVDFISGKHEIIEFAAPIQYIQFSEEGVVQVILHNREVVEKDIFARSFFSSWQSRQAQSMLSPNEQELVFFQGAQVFIKELDTEYIREIFRASGHIHGVWWLKDSSDILVVTPQDIFLWNEISKDQRLLLSGANIEEAFLLYAFDLLVYKDAGTWKSWSL